MDKILSISIAAYQSENYIRQTLNSLLDERIIDEVEVFVIDDGGTDKTLNIANEYAAKYPKSFFLIHKENEGYGSTVNYSIAHATGKYFKCLDGDDWFSGKGFYELVVALRESEADVVITPYCRCVQGKKPVLRIYPVEKNREYREVSKLQEKNLCFYTWEITYRTEILQNIDLKLPNHMLYTDMVYNTIPFCVAETIQFLDKYVYCYRIGREGQSISLESRKRNLRDYLEICEQLCGFCREQRANKNYQYILRRTSRYCFSAIKSILLNPINENTLEIYKSFESMVQATCPDVEKYIFEVMTGKYVNLIKLIRKTHYAAYWLLGLVPFRKTLMSRWTRR